MTTHNIKVGIKTHGRPIFSNCGDYSILENMLIGDGFHWQRVIQAKFPGTLEPYQPVETDGSVTSHDDKITLVNTLPLETYLECVVASEMNPSAPIEFLKAHAVISRSWALGKILNVHEKDDTGKTNTANSLTGWDDTATHSGFHVCSDDHCQRYQGLQIIDPISLKTIRDTSGEVLITPQGEILDTRFSKCCGGKTEIFETCWQSKKIDCLESIIDPWCNLSKLSPLRRKALLSTILKDYDLETEGYGYRWQTHISKEDVGLNLKEKFGRDLGEIQKIEPLHRGPSGRIDLLRITGSKGYLDLGKELWIRRLLSPTHLYSSAFEIQDTGDSFILKGNGWGHGVGLCQIGAANMGAKGSTYRDILAFYYPGSKLIKV